jgi:uncharacterized phiE125 gp8 family phage protein
MCKEREVTLMALKLITVVVDEPVTLTEAKEHIKLDSTSFVDNIETVTSINGGYHATAIYTGTSTDVSGYDAAVLLTSFVNSAGGTVDVSIYESDDNITFVVWTAGSTFAQVTTANDTANYEVAYTGGKQYIRAYATVTGAECNFAVMIVKGAPASIEDDYISDLITTAREYCEDYQHRALATQTWDLILDEFPSCSDYIEIPLPPLQSVTSVKYVDYAGVTATMTASLSGYFVDTDSEPARVCLSYCITWPIFTEYPYGAVRIRFVAGHTNTAPDVIPKKTKQAMFMLISYMYENRLPSAKDIDQEFKNCIESLLDANKIYTL